MSKSLHVISFDVPFPPDYGGVIDIYYKLKSLHEKGIVITLHCFQDKRIKQETLLTICREVIYYPRKTGFNYFLGNLPYIVNTRVSDKLILNLMKDNYPILFEGIHTTALLKDLRLKERIKLVRMHNIEDEYYKELAATENNIFRKYYFTSESIKLQYYQKNLDQADYILPISEFDREKILHILPDYDPQKVITVPPFHSNSEVVGKEGFGDYALYHGNLSVNENNKAALFLVKKVFNDIGVELIIAGNSPKSQLMNSYLRYKNINIRDNPNIHLINALIANAHINILPTFQESGIKLKLLNSLFRGRFCLVNSKMLYGTGLEQICNIAETPLDFKNLIPKLMSKKFDMMEINNRKKVLSERYDNRKNAEKIFNLLP